MSVFSNVLPGRSMNTRKAFTQQQQQEDEEEEMVNWSGGNSCPVRTEYVLTDKLLPSCCRYLLELLEEHPGQGIGWDLLHESGEPSHVEPCYP